MYRRRCLVATGGVVTTLWSGAVGATEHEGEGENESDEDEKPAFVPEDHEPDPLEFEGNGSEVLKGVEIDGGFTVVAATYDGPEVGNFVVELVPEDGEFGELFQNQLEPYDGERAAVVTAGTYLLDVDADGPWEIEIYQPRADEGESLPQEFEGETDRVYGPFEFAGSHVATGSHAGQGNFIVEVLPMAESGFGELVFNEIDDVEASETVFRFDDIGWIAVQAGGDWQLRVESPG